MANAIDRITEPYRQSIENAYNHMIEQYFDGSYYWSEIVLSITISIGVYWIVGLLYTLFDLTGYPKFFLRYKIQPNTNLYTTTTTSTKKNSPSLYKLIKQVIFNQLFTLPLLFVVMNIKYANPSNVTKIASKPLPTLTNFCLQWCIFVLTREALFYYSHRALHHPAVYRHIHKRHHEWQTPVAIVAIYCHPIEHILSNILPVFIGPLLMNAHTLVEHLWLLYVVILTLNDHSGYHFPYNPFSPVFHDFHHLKFNVNYGILGLCDWLHGTDKSFRQSKYYSMNRMYFSLTPPKDMQM